LPSDVAPAPLTTAEVLGLHAALIDAFGGSHGVRDQSLLESALAQPFAGFGDVDAHPGVTDKAAAYLFYLRRNHPFVDGNKRTAYAAMRLYLALAGLRLRLTQDEKYALVLVVATGEMDVDALKLAVAGACTR
jgi:death on curing protein